VRCNGKVEGIDRSAGLWQKRDMDDILLETLSAGADAIGVGLGPDQLDRFAVYYRELLLWNRRINLVSERSSRQIVVRHFIDSLTPAPFLNRPEGELIDMGSGGGFPGIPLKIALPGLTVSLVEASRKKASFLAHLIRMLDLGGVQVAQARVETLTANQAWHGRFDALVSRAAFKLPELIRMAPFFLKPGGQLIAMKGPDPQEELAETERFSKAAGMVFAACRDVHPPGAESLKKIIIYNHVSR
jgi:16S rRNA (guanine527-N7)-methyltransferase